MNAQRLRALAAVLCIVAAISTTGCYKQLAYQTPTVAENEKACGEDGCHPEQAAAQADSVHAERRCTACHEGTGSEHAARPKEAIASTDWTIESCEGCHKGEAATYLYDDNSQAGPFGGSIRVPPQPKKETFPEYNTIVAGHAFTRDYNEEGAHAYMLEDHYQTLRGKFETCVQCKSSKLAYAWKEGKPLRVASDTEITLTHTATEGVPPKKVKVPKGTLISYATDERTQQVDAKATLPDGTVYTSKPKPSEDATLSNNMLWASTIAAIKETMPYGAGCNHCHDPHTGAPRVIREAMLRSIEGTGGIKGAGGVNPYQDGSPKSFDNASAKDQRVLACAQCHVEYVCGRSGIDKIDRDAFGWAKAQDLHEVYTNQYGYSQDFKNAIMGQPLIKSQHPESELYWNSPHYQAGASCDSCHMPEVTYDGKTIRSHWFTSPYKYSDPKLFAKFAAKVGVAAEPSNPCILCHSDRTELAIQQQKQFYKAQGAVQGLLSQSVKNMGALRSTSQTRTAEYKEALASHQKAHAIWENLAVSENSMGFHNFGESMDAIAEAKTEISSAVELEQKLLK